MFFEEQMSSKEQKLFAKAVDHTFIIKSADLANI
jgi:hypothetical protein